jgi:hypothetical protein
MKTNNEIKKTKKKFCLDNISKFCDKCGTPYDLDDVQIIQEAGPSMTIIHFFCRKCGSENVASFVSSMGLATKIPINCDLNLKELKRFTSANVISLDDILELHIKLEDNEGCVEI